MLLRLLVMAVGIPSVALAASNEALRSCFENVLTDPGSFAFAGDLFYDRIVNRRFCSRTVYCVLAHRSQFFSAGG